MYSDGSIYQGLAQQGKAQGRGGLLYANGDSYVPGTKPPLRARASMRRFPRSYHRAAWRWE